MHERLRQIVDTATAGPWWETNGSQLYSWVDERHVGGHHDRRFTATFNPQTIAAMLDVIDQAEDALDGGNPDDLVDALTRFWEVARG